MQIIRIMTFRLTEKRKQILHVLEQHHGTLTAAEVHAQVSDIDLATVYRNLDLFVREKLIKQIHFGAGEAQYEFQKEPHHHAVCNDCHKVIHFTAPEERLKKVLGLTNFDIDEIEVTVRGSCK